MRLFAAVRESIFQRKEEKAMLLTRQIATRSLGLVISLIAVLITGSTTGAAAAAGSNEETLSP
jgi:hypothetical protein